MDRFLIAPFNSGLQQDLKSWMLPEDAFSVLNNAYVWRGRIRKRFGSRFMGQGWNSNITEPLFSRFRIDVATTDASGDAAGTVPGAVFKVGQQFSVGNNIYTVVSSTPGVQPMLSSGFAVGTTDASGNAAGIGTTGTAVTGQYFTINGTIFTITGAGLNPLAVSGLGVGTGTYNTVTSAYTFTGASPNQTIYFHPSGTYNITNGAYIITGALAAFPVWFYPAEPVMGLTNYGDNGTPINDQVSYGFDTQFAYVFAGGFWQRSGTAIWHGSDINFFWPTNWQGISDNPVLMFVSNFHVTNPNGAPAAGDDPLWYFDGTTWTSISGANGFYTGPGGGAPHTGPFIQTARIVLPFKNRLLLLNTIENDGSGNQTNYVSRVRFCHFGSPLSVNAWYEANQTDNAGGVGDGGGYNDAATEEQIISAEFIKDRLIVFFERSTWELAYTGNAVQPFQWQKINTELGSESQFSSVPFDTQILTVGNTGVHACTGPNVQRIDVKIPDQVFRITNKNVGVQRVVGIRDYFPEMVYWTFPSEALNDADTFPNKVLVYNYRNGSWSFNDDSITMFGYFNQQQALTWEDQTGTWEDSNFSWNSGSTQAQFRQVIGGNQQGYTFIIDSNESRNERALQITNLTYHSTNIVELQIIDHNLQVNDYITIENATTLMLPASPIFPIIAVIDADTIRIKTNAISGVYNGGANAARVSNINIVSKQWNPYVTRDRNLHLAKIDFCVLRTSNGEITVDYAPSSSSISMINDGGPTGTNSMLGNNVLETHPYQYASSTLEQTQENLWHPITFQTDGTCVQIEMYFSSDQIMDEDIAFSPFEISGICLYTQPTSARLQ